VSVDPGLRATDDVHGFPRFSPVRTLEHTDIWRTGKITKRAISGITAGQVVYV
jgi:hypothetical protein